MGAAVLYFVPAYLYWQAARSAQVELTALRSAAL
jgi:hypothetical protein